MSTASIERTTFKTSRLLDFCSQRGLIKQIGHGVDKWPLVVGKEVTDNVIDAAEEAGIALMIRIQVSDNEIMMADNGPGVPAETVASIVDFSVRVSSREVYASPTRGVHGKRTQALFDWAQSVLAQLGLVEAISPSCMPITRHIKQHHFLRPIKFGGRVGYVRWWSAIVERWANEWMIAPLGNELVRSARPHQGAHDPVRGQSTQSVETVGKRHDN